jgi:hypothetical protein
MPSSSQKTLTTTASIIVAANRADQIVKLHSKGAFLIGGADLTASNGFVVDNGDKLTIQLSDNEALYGITSTGTSDVSILVTIN